MLRISYARRSGTFWGDSCKMMSWMSCTARAPSLVSWFLVVYWQDLASILHIVRILSYYANVLASERVSQGPPPLTVFSTFISRKIEEAPGIFLRRLEVAWPNSFRSGPIFRRVSLTRNESRKSREGMGSCFTPQIEYSRVFTVIRGRAGRGRKYGLARDRLRATPQLNSWYLEYFLGRVSLF